MIDREYRDAYKDLFEQFYYGDITNSELIDRIDAIGEATPDPAIKAMIREVEDLFDDTMGNTYRLSDPDAQHGKPFIARLIEFLGTDIEYDRESMPRRKRRFRGSCGQVFLHVATLGMYSLLHSHLWKPHFVETPEGLWGSWPFPGNRRKNR